jgi:hypothetical protein
MPGTTAKRKQRRERRARETYREYERETDPEAREYLWSALTAQMAILYLDAIQEGRSLPARERERLKKALAR